MPETLISGWEEDFAAILAHDSGAPDDWANHPDLTKGSKVKVIQREWQCWVPSDAYEGFRATVIGDHTSDGEALVEFDYGETMAVCIADIRHHNYGEYQ